MLLLLIGGVLALSPTLNGVLLAARPEAWPDAADAELAAALHLTGR